MTFAKQFWNLGGSYLKHKREELLNLYFFRQYEQQVVEFFSPSQDAPSLLVRNFKANPA